MKKFIAIIIAIVILGQVQAGVRIKELARIKGIQDNPLVGYGLVVGLAGTGDSQKNRATLQSLANTLENFSVRVTTADLSSKNVAAVMVTAQLPPFAQVGDKLEVNVSSLGDARSLHGGTLLMTPMEAANGEIFALAQGALSVGGYRHDFNGNRVQKNHPTVGVIPDGAKVEREIEYQFENEHSEITLLLNEPDFTTADRIATALEDHFPGSSVTSNHPGKVVMRMAEETPLLRMVANIESLEVTPDKFAKVVVNERNGTLVAGAEVKVDDVVISHGSLKLTIATRFSVSQPTGFFEDTSDTIGTRVIANSDLEIEESAGQNIAVNGTTIAEVIESLSALELPTRDLISILQAIHKAGALHAELIIQ